MPRRSAYGRLLDHFHTHPKGRLHEFLFWTVLGALLAGLTAVAYFTDNLSLPLSLIAWIIAACFVGWAFLPQKKAPPPKKSTGRLRAEKAEAVRQSKAEGRRFKAAKRGDRP